ncbi:acyltransferase [Pseudomonas sp. GM55]|uniref:acyltransferase n=1 Tax=Pseudomonas sp. GM55 TaxID=1144333 RepID=UPI00027066E7|nr:acyltransferase [Pseudomonas sp. GM55]EJM78140.1 acetyltransferase (isoleucine patch superfamily) [Pseudomonas sp. GM55]
MGKQYNDVSSLPDVVSAPGLTMASSWLELEPSSAVKFGLEVKLMGARISVGVNAELVIGGLSEVRGRIIVADNCRVVIGEGLICNSEIKIHACERANVLIGRDCLFANPQIFSSDLHSIYSDVGERLNFAKDVVIGDKVWLATNSLILKGAHVSSGSIVGAGAIVSGRHPANVVLGGNPAKVIKTDIRWSRYLTDSMKFDVPESFSPSMFCLAGKQSDHDYVLKVGIQLWPFWEKMDHGNHFIFYYLAKSLFLSFFNSSTEKDIVLSGVLVGLKDIYSCLLLAFEKSGGRNFPCGSYAYAVANKLGLANEAQRLYAKIHPVWSHIDGAAFRVS